MDGSQPRAPDDHDGWLHLWDDAIALAGSAGSTYLRARGIDEGLATVSGLRFSFDFLGAPAILFPIRDRMGTLVAVTGRYCDSNIPKARTVGRLMDGLFATPAALETSPLLVSEAPLDALTLASCGLPSIALCGTRWPRWLPVVAGFRAVAIATDADAGGDTCAAALTSVLRSLGATVSRWRPAGAKDWNEALISGFGLPCWTCAMAGHSYVPARFSSADGCWTCGSHDLGEDSLEASGRTELQDKADPAAEGPYASRLPGDSLAYERHRRASALVALDRRRYPRLRLSDGRTVGPGLLAWAPVLREMDAPTLDVLLRLIEGLRP